MARTQSLLLFLLVVIVHLYYGLSLSINIKAENNLNQYESSPNLLSNISSIQEGIDKNITYEDGIIKNKTLQEVLNGLMSMGNDDDIETWMCTSCKVVARAMGSYIYFGGKMNGTIERSLRNICTMITGFDSDTFCTGLISEPENQMELEWIYSHAWVWPETSCSQLLGNRGCRDFRGGEWTIKLPPSKNGLSTNEKQLINSEISSSDQYIQIHNNFLNEIETANSKKEQNIQKDEDDQNLNEDLADVMNSSELVVKHKLKVLHLTDPHYDPRYKVGSNAACYEPLCCNEDSGVPQNPSDAAGKWGDYRHCDSPKVLLENMYQHIVDNHPDIDYIMNTGDLVPHHIWKVTQQENLDIISESSEMMEHYFPDIPIYSTIGNHESFPVNSFPPPETEAWNHFNVQWLYDALSDHWSTLMHQEVPSTVKYAGYYTVLIRPGFRIISINTNYCYRFNWWLLYKSEDPGDVLKWLTNELESAEAAEEKVHIIGHVPPLISDCFQQWGHQFSRIVTRFSATIKGQFYGHSHFDEFRMHYDTDNTDIPVGVEYMTPNNGPFKFLNPAYRIFYVDGEHQDSERDVLDYETWVMNLTHANLYDDPHWYKLYSAKQDLEMDSLKPEEWNKLVYRMAEDKPFFDKYFRYRIQDSDVELELGCNEYCQREILCVSVDGNKLIPKKCL